MIKFNYKLLDIILWKLRYPVIITCTQPIKLLPNLRCLIISDLLISLDDDFIKDVIRAMCIADTEVYAVTVNKIDNIILPKKFLNCCWWIGIQISHNFHCINLNTPSLDVLKNDIDSKRDLWNQISSCSYNN